MASYLTSNVKLHWGGAAFSVDLADELAGPFTLTGAVSVPRRRVQGQSGVTADGVAAGLSAAGVFYASDTLDTLIANLDGFLAVEQTDSARVLVIPMLVVSVGLAAPAANALTRAVRFVQSDNGGVVEGARSTSNLTLSSGEEGYLITSSAITRSTSGTVTVGASQIGVKGTPITAEAA